MTRSRGVVLGGVTLLAACSQTAGPLPQWTVHLATDVPIPELGEQLFIENIDANGDDVALAPSATRFVDVSSPSTWPVSFGVVPHSEASPRIRVRLYRIEETGVDGLPQGSALIDATATLPPTGAGVTSVSLVLAGACFGIAPDLAGHRTCNPATGALDAEPTLPANPSLDALPALGSWVPAAPKPCAATIPDGMVCVPGGVALLGSPQFYALQPDTVPVPEQLVQLAPFALDAYEVTVGQVRPLVQSGKLTAPLAGDLDANASPPECTYPASSNDPSKDLYPVNCVSWSQANAACLALGRRLPTEAEWEFAASNGTAKTPYPWGTSATDADVCAHARVGYGRASNPLEGKECEGAGAVLGPLPGTVSADVTYNELFNMAGNVNEWTADDFQPYVGSCWSASSALLSQPPPCSVMNSALPCKNPSHAIRGGSWADAPLQGRAYARNCSVDGDQPGTATGFRCAWPP